MRRLLLVLILSALPVRAGDDPGLLFHRFVEDAARSKGIADVVVVVDPEPPANTYLARAQFNHYVQRVFIRHDVLLSASPGLLKLLAYHEVCHIYLWRRELPDTEDDVDVCVRQMFWSKTEWSRAAWEAATWRPED